MNPINDAHAFQIQAGVIGRKAGHKFEDELVLRINTIDLNDLRSQSISNHVVVGCPADLLVTYIISDIGLEELGSISAFSTGALATSEDGKKWLEINGIKVRRCKSDIILKLVKSDGTEHFVGVSTKQCNNIKPTNAQLYFTTAAGFSRLLRDNNFQIPEIAETALKQFCGDVGYRPLDDNDVMQFRQTDPRRYFWEEIASEGKKFWEKLFTKNQKDITLLLLQKAYLDDPFVPEYVIHKTKRAENWENTEVAIYTMAELVKHSSFYSGFSVKEYAVYKGQYRDPAGVKHLAPRFGIVQMQRGGQAQHPTQLQFNLQAGYFYKITQERS